MKSFAFALALTSALLAGCAESVSPYDADAHASSTAPPHPPKGRMWLRRDGVTRLWWADDLRREWLVSYAGTWELVDKAEASGISFIEVTPKGVIGRNDEGEVVMNLATAPPSSDCALPMDYR